MSDLDPIRRHLETDDAFVRTDDADDYRLTTTAFDATISLASVSTDSTLTVVVRAPMLSAVVEGDAVADVVEQGWFETFERRLEDAAMALEGDFASEPTVSADGDDLVVEGGTSVDAPDRSVADAKAFVEYVEGTYMEGVIPGYDYTDPVASMRDKAHTQG